jgi:uncharacterized membrane protein
MDVLAMSWILRLLGRFHPTTIHFPIAFLLVAAVVELLGILRKKPLLTECLYPALAIGSLGAVLAAALGWADAASLRFDPDDRFTLAVHRWLGTAAALLSSAACVYDLASRRGASGGSRVVFRTLLFSSAVAVAVGAHFGGILVYGHDYYTSALTGNGAPAPTTDAPHPSPTAKALRFQEDILPVLEHYCVRCHGPKKQNGRLRLDSRAGVLQGGKLGPSIVPGASARSPLYRAITDPEPDTRMPQEGQPLPPELIHRIQAWIDEGAP